jgi:hypothetical protein
MASPSVPLPQDSADAQQLAARTEAQAGLSPSEHEPSPAHEQVPVHQHQSPALESSSVHLAAGLDQNGVMKWLRVNQRGREASSNAFAAHLMGQVTSSSPVTPVVPSSGYNVYDTAALLQAPAHNETYALAHDEGYQHGAGLGAEGSTERYEEDLSFMFSDFLNE